MNNRKLKNTLSYIKIYFGIGISVTILFSILILVLINGIQNLSFEFVFSLDAPRGFSLMPMLATTTVIVVLTLLISVPLGISSAIYLNEYASSKSKLVKIVRSSIETLSGIPSIIYGLFGFLFYVIVLGWSWSIRAGIFTVAIMILPIIIRATEEALKAVPMSYRMGSYALGAGKFYTIRKVVLPAAINGILASIILSIGRLIGETAALLLTAGTLLDMPVNLQSSAATLSVFMYTITIEQGDMNRAYATAIVLMALVLSLNLLANFIAKRLKRD
ncbi:MAG: phosphate ABC transporter permease PstA [Defluviitaleaceae bacterium]|nr:phosphate ABC transporter permease PstA [Defluviitaleaceae bacterium]